MDFVILDTNVFVAAGFNPESASARIVEQIRAGRLRMVWNEQTRRETLTILSRIPPLASRDFEDLFREEDRYDAPAVPEKFDYIPDAGDRKFAALAEASGAVLITNDAHLLDHRERAGLPILTPEEYRRRHG